MSNTSKFGYSATPSSTKKGQLKTPKPTPVVGGIRGGGRKTSSSSTTTDGASASTTTFDRTASPTQASATTATNFVRFLKDHSLPVPPVLYEPVSRKEPLNRIKVMLRLVPMSQIPSSAKKSDNEYLSVDQKRKQISVVENFGLLQPRSSTVTKIAPKIFTFDHVFSADDSADQICNQTLTEVIQTVLNGNDACVLSFGHVASGENRTMIGSCQNRNSIGIIPCSISWLYRLVNDTKQKNEARFSIRVSAVEIFGPNEELRDLLATHQQPPNSAKICIKDDPVSGLKLCNVNEVRAPTVEKAAYYFDAVLAERKAGTEEERRNSHLFFTLHVYQYQVDKGGGAVAGGRTRLHLIDLGLGEKNSKAGRASLTMPAIGNVLLTLLQGQKHLPFKDCKLAQLLKEAIGSQSCKSVAIIGNVSADSEKHVETINAVQIASRLQRLRRNHGRRIRMGIGGSNSSGGESSGDDRGPNGYLNRKKLHRSASDPDCAASGSEQSNATVIFNGNRDLVQSGVSGHKNSAQKKSGSKASLGGGIFFAGSDWESTDVETVIAASNYAKNPKFHRAAPKPLPQPAMGVIRENLTASQSKIHQIPQKRAFVEQSHSSAWQWVGPTTSPKFSPKSWSSNANIPAPRGQWIDGPGVKDLGQEMHDQPSPASLVKRCQSSAYLDPLKHEFIRQWVHLQEIEHFGRTSIGSTFGDLPAYSKSNFDSIENPSVEDDREVEKRDICVQINEEDIDAEGGSFPANVPNFDHHAAGRYLEDIVEVEEEETQSEKKSSRSDGCQSRASKKSCRRSAFQFSEGQGSLKREYEALATLDVNSFFDNLANKGCDLHSFTIPSTSLTQDHPLRILSRECMDTKSDSFSFTTDNLENGSFCETDQLDDDIPTDEELERAMQASLTSIRSHELLAKLKAENFPNNLSTRKLIGVGDDSSPSAYKNLLNLRTFDEALCSVEMDVVGPLEPEDSLSLKLTPLAPRLLIPVQDPVNNNTHSTQLLKRPSNLPSLAGCQTPKIGAKESKLKPLAVKPNKDEKNNPKNNDKSKAASENVTESPAKMDKRSKLDRNNGTGRTSPIVPKSIAQSVPVVRCQTENLMPCTKSSNTVIPPPNNRNSLGYDSGHDSGIGMVTTVDSPEHPLLRTSPYSKLTRPRIGSGGCSGAGHWSSSGHGSDNSSAVSSDFGFSRSYGGRRSINSKTKQIPDDQNRGCGVKILKYDDSAGLTVGNENLSMKIKSIDDNMSNNDRNLRSSMKLNKQTKQTKLGWLENMARNVIGKSNSGPQHFSILSPRHESKLKFPIKTIFGHKSQTDKSQRSEIDRLHQMQSILKEELKNAKERLGVPANKWNYDLHISQYNNSLNQSDFLEALRQETRILEKRVAACKSHVMMVTVFDSTSGSRTIQ